MRSGAGLGLLEWILNLGIFGCWAGATTLSKAIYWVHILYIIISAAIPWVIKGALPAGRWVWSVQAVLQSVTGLTV